MLLPKRDFLTHTKARPHKLLKQLRGIVIHWTANVSAGANAAANRSYFNQGFRSASAHYIVDDSNIIQCLPDQEVGYHCGDRPLGKYKPIGLGLMNGYKGTTPNYFTIGIEMCVNRDGNWLETYSNTIDLVARLYLKYQLNPGSIIRHFDVTGKQCPKPFLKPSAWEQFIQDVIIEIQTLTFHDCKIGIVTSKQLNIRPGVSNLSRLLGVLDEGETVLWTQESNGWGLIADGAWINLNFVNQI